MKKSTTSYGLFLDIQTNQHLMYHRRGIPRFSSEQAIALLKWPGLVRGIGLNPLRPFPDYLAPELLNSPLLAWSSLDTFEKASASGPMAFYAMSPFELGPSADSMFPSYAMRPEIPIIMTLYDLIPLKRPKQYLGRDLAKAYHIRLETLKQADLILCISEHTRTDAISMLNLDHDRLVTIGGGVSGFFRPAGEEDRPSDLIAREISGIRKPFVLSVSGAEPRKNTEGLIQAFARLPPELRRDLQLVIVCVLNDDYVESWTTIARQSGLGEQDVILTNLIPDSLLLALYRSARLFVFPSFYEGFGLPAAEAAACGCPVITSNTSSMPEILDFPESTFEPSDCDSIAAKMTAALVDEEFRSHLRRAGRKATGKWTWEAVGNRTVEALKRLPPPKPRKSLRRAPRIALAGPFPPLRSGIADYNLRLARELAPHCEMDLLIPVDHPDHDLAPQIAGVRVFPVEALGRYLNPFAYDHLIYVLGNNEHHHSTYQKAISYPGVVWLHDTQLAGLYISYGRDRWEGASAKNFAGYKLHQMYGQRSPVGLIERADDSIEQYVRHGIGMTPEVVGHSNGVVVTSRLAQDLVALDMGPFTRMPPVEIIPLAVPSFPQRLHPYEGPPIIGSFGILGSHKAPEVLLEALAIVREAVDCRLVFAGPIYDDDLKVDLALKARKLGIENAVQFTGNLNHFDYIQALHQVTCAVQIRRGTQGESSAAIADCLGAGVPVITNLLSSWDLPKGTVDLVAADPSPTLLAGRVRLMLSDSGHRRSFSDAGINYARSHTFPAAAAHLLQFCESLKTESHSMRPVL